MEEVNSSYPSVSVTVAVFFFLFKPCKHSNYMRPGCMSKGSQIKVNDNKGAEEYPKKDMNSINDLYPNNVYNWRKQFWVPQK